MNREKMISYAQAFVSFLFRTPGIKSEYINSIYLFGSVARGDFDEESDIDLFVNIDKEYEKVFPAISKLSIKNFYKSDESKKFDLLGIKNKISIKYGRIHEWDIFKSVRNEGILLYSASVSLFFRKYFLVEVKTIGNITKRNRILRKLVGRNEVGRKEKGLVKIIGGEIIDSRHYIIPAEKISSITRILSKENAFFELKEIWM